MNILKNEENISNLIDFPDYNNIRDKIIEKQGKINLDDEKFKILYLDIIKDLISLAEKVDSENINKEINISYIKYIFSLAKLYLKNNNNISNNDSNLLINIFKNIFSSTQFIKNINDIILFELLEEIHDNNIIYQNCLAEIINNYNSKTKELYYRDISEIEKCIDIQKLLKNY